MALELETEVMRDIGLDNHYNWFNGSGSCKWVRQEAARKLPDAIRSRSDNGEAIAEPDEKLCAILVKIAEISESSKYFLTNTWEAASDIIAEHMRQAEATPEVRREGYERLERYLNERYLSFPRSVKRAVV